MPALLLAAVLLGAAPTPGGAPATDPAAPRLLGPVELTDENEILVDSPPRTISAVELYGLLGRQDLVDRVHANARARLGLFIAAGAVAAAGVVAGIVFFATAPVMGGASRCNSGDLAYYNSYCQPQWVLHTQGGAFSLVGGLGLGGVMAAVGLLLRPEVLDRVQLDRLIRDANASLPRVELTPWLAPGGGGLLAFTRF